MKNPEPIKLPSAQFQYIKEGHMITNKFQGVYIAGNFQKDPEPIGSANIGRIGGVFGSYQPNKSPVNVQGGRINCICTRQDTSIAYFNQVSGSNRDHPLVITTALLSGGGFKVDLPLGLKGLPDEVSEVTAITISCDEKNDELYLRCSAGMGQKPFFDGFVIINTQTGDYINKINLPDYGVNEDVGALDTLAIPPCFSDEGKIFIAPVKTTAGNPVKILVLQDANDPVGSSILIKDNANDDDFILNMLIDNTSKTLYVFFSDYNAETNVGTAYVKRYSTIGNMDPVGKDINIPFADAGITPAAINEAKQQLYINPNDDQHFNQIIVIDLNNISNPIPPITLPELVPLQDYYNNLIVNDNGDINICTQNSCTINIILSENIPT